MRRFEQLWERWDANLQRTPAAAVIPALTDEDVIELLAGAPPTRRLERNLLATEALNRASRARREIVELSQTVSEDVLRLRSLVELGIERAREEEERLGTTEGREERELARRAVTEHIRSTGAMLALQDAAKRLVELREASLARTRNPDAYIVA